ncbi:MAG: hypothetical protein ABIO63_08980 [Casimicrobiaceae bacterium]
MISSNTFKDINLFTQSTPQIQLSLLAQYVLELDQDNITQIDRDLFEERLQVYTEQRGITMARATEKVYNFIHNTVIQKEYLFGINVKRGRND